MLVRQSEADEPAGTQPQTAASARAAGIRWFRWAWAGPALAALLVIGIYVSGPFRHEIQQMPGPEHKIQNPSPGKPTASPPVSAGARSEIAPPSVSGSGNAQKSQPAEKKTLASKLQTGTSGGEPEGPHVEPARVNNPGGISAHKESPVRSQIEETRPMHAPATPPPPPVRAGAIATPSERGDLAKKDEEGQGAGVGGSTAPRVVGESISGTTSNKPASNPTAGNLETTGRSVQAISPQPVPPIANRKSVLQAETKTKKQAQTNEPTPDNLRPNDREKRQAAQSLSIRSSTEQVMVTRASVAPVWRVGRHGLIQKLDASGKWRKQKSGVKADLFAIEFSSSGVGWAAGQSGTVLRTTDGGATWSQLPGPATEDLVQVTAITDQAASVVTRSGQTFTTTDGGHTWSAGGH